MIDEEVSRILREADQKATELLTTNRHYLEAVTRELTSREEMLRSEIEDVLRANGMDIPVEKPRDNPVGEIAAEDPKAASKVFEGEIKPDGESPSA